MKIKLLLPIVLILLFLSVPALAWTDNFDDCEIVSEWTTIVTVGTSSLGESDCYFTNLLAGSGSARRLGIGNNTYWSFEIYANDWTVPAQDQINVYFEFDNGVELGHGLQFVGGAGGVGSINDIGMASFTDLPNYLGTSGRYRVEIWNHRSSNQYEVTITNITGGNTTVVNSQVFGEITYPNAYDFRITFAAGASANNEMRVDDIVASVVSPQAANTITWGSDNYVKDDSGSYTWAISDANWNDAFLGLIPYSFYADVYKSSSSGLVFDKEVELNTQTGTRYYTFADTGTYQVRLIKYLSYIGITSTTIANDSIVVRNQGISYLHLNSTMAAGIPQNYQYLWGFTPFVQSYLNGINIKKLQQDGTYKTYAFQTVNNLAIAANTLYTGTLTPSEEGNYVFRLVDIAKGEIGDPVYATVTFNFVTPTENITTSWINIDQTTYLYGQNIIGDYGVDNTNFSVYQKYIRIQNLGTGNFAIDGFSQTKQSNTFDIPIVNSQEREICIFGSTCFQMPQTTFIAGNNQIQLVGKNGTETKILAYQNFTLSQTNTAGYGLILSKSKVCQNEQFTAKIIAPTTSTLILFNANKYIELKRWTINGSNISVPIKISLIGNYELNLIGASSNVTQITQVIEVADCAIPTPTTTPETGSTRATSLANLLDSNLFWALIFTVGMMIAVAYASRK